jgi:asparagine synthase (glutamine-hydrolysing)
MSAIGGAYSRTGAPIDSEVLGAISRSLQQMGPDGERIESSSPVAMIFRPFHTDRDSRLTLQPVATGDGLLLSWDGRLDNRKELRHVLHADLPEDPRTVDLVLAAYRRWGIDAFVRLLGDFALALWDEREQRLLLVCDAVGLRPLYYSVAPDLVVWASKSRALLDALGLPVELEDDFIASFLVNSPSEHSPFKKIEALPGGCVLAVDKGAATLRRYWSLDPRHQIRYRSDAEYEAHFNELFREVVACRLEGEGPVYAELSGGLDSSSIVCVGDRILAGSDAGAAELRTVSYVFDRATNSDERPYIHLVEAQRQQPGLHILEEDHPILRPLPESFRPDLPTNQICFLARHDRLADQMREEGSRVLLSGLGGDQMFWTEPPEPLHLADLLVEGRLPELLRSCAEWSRLRRWPFLKTLWQSAIWPALPRTLQARALFRARLGEWLEPGFVKRTDLRERTLGPIDDAGFRLPSSSQQHSLIRRSLRIFALERCLSEGYTEVRYPYLDRRLIEFAMAIPLDQKLRPGESRSIVRRSLRGILPEAVRQRRSKAGPDQAFRRAVVREWPWVSGLLSDPRVARYGFVDRQTFVSTLHRARHGGWIKNPAQMMRTLSLELWLRSLEVPRADGSKQAGTISTMPTSIRRTRKGEYHGDQSELRIA